MEAVQRQCDSAADPKSAITTDVAGMHITSPKDVCFHTGSDGDICIGKGLIPAIESILSEQNVIINNLTSLREDLTATLANQMGVLAKNVTTNDAGLTAVKAELTDYCGRSCYQGEYVATTCAPGQKAVCSAFYR